MNIGAIARRSAGTGAAIAALLAIAPAAQADFTPVWSSACGDPALSQPFLAFGDSSCYTPAPGESADSFSGTGWTLSGGATIQTRTLYDGSQGSVLDLPSGSTAISPLVWVKSTDPTARTMVRNVVGAEGVFFYISYLAQPWKNTGQVHGHGTAWTLSDPVNLQSNGLTNWTLAQFKFVPGGKASDFQIYNFYYQATSVPPGGTFSADPRMKH
jgi:hypothetical protein